MKKTLTSFLLHYFRLLAKIQIAKISFLQKINRKNLTIVGITGSAGKSSTLNVCESALKDYIVVKTNHGSNSESGIPLSILGVKVSNYSSMDWIKYAIRAKLAILTNWQKYDVLILEMGIDGPDEPKNMSYLLKIVKPTIGIFLNVNLVHSLQFDKTVASNITGNQRTTQILENIGREKAKLINSLPASGKALININDPIVSKTTQISLAQKIALKPIHLDFLNYAPPQSFDISISAAVNLATILGISQENAIKSIQKNLVLPPSRCSFIKGEKDSLIIDSTYNSSPLACQELLSVLSHYKSPRIAVLGDMRELGLQSEVAHQHLYQQALKSADTIISVGPETKKYFGSKAQKFLFWWQALDYLEENLKPKSTLLIKGSQNTIFLEEIVKALSTSKSLICRQTLYWLKLKEKFRTDNS